MVSENIIEEIRQRADIVDVISDYDNSENSIGYSYCYYAKTMFTND